MSFSNLLEAFEPLHARKLENPESLDEDEQRTWRALRRQIDEALFHFAPGPGAERREHLRAPVALSARYWTADELKDRYIPVLGEGGLFISTVEPLAVGTELDLEIDLAEKHFSFWVRGEVVWSNGGADAARPGMGIKFIDLDYDQKVILYNLVADSVREHLLERRQYTRLDSRLHARFCEDGGEYSLHTADLSVGGMFIASDHLVEPGERFRVLLEVPGRDEPVRVSAEVIRNVDTASPGQPAGFGLDFRMIDEDGKKALLDHMVERATGSGRPAKPNGEQRARPRIKRRIKMMVRHQNGWGTTYCRDISSAGVFIRTHEPPPAGSEVEVDIEHPGSRRHLKLRGKVVRLVQPDPARPHQVPGAGVRFYPPGAGKQRLLEEFLKEFILLEGTGPDSQPPPSA